MTLFEPELDLQESAPTGPTLRVRLLVAYDGTDFRGFADQPGVRTVAGSILDAVRRVLGLSSLELTCAGRTDAGVHAWGQVVHLDLPEHADPAALQQSLNKMLRPSIVVREAEVVDPSFDARRSARARRYRYTVLNRPVPDPFLHRYTWHVEQPLDVRAMQAACDPFLGEHDFSSFCRRIEGGSLVRRVLDARWRDLGEGILRFDIDASSFCQQMVRSIVGTLVDVGLGKKRAGDMAWILRSGDRHAAGPVAPPSGLCLWEVVY